jgi:isopentenyl phosphate kinase
MLVFLKLGGSLITDKASVHKPRLRLIRRLLGEVKSALDSQPDLQIIFGHGSGSFGHVPAKKYGTINGVQTPEEWQGFLEVWREAHSLDQIIMEEFAKTGLPALSFPPSACVLVDNRKIVAWDLAGLQNTLTRGLLPVLFGDVVFDHTLGGTILSTEELFLHLAPILKPERILLAGEEAGVWSDFSRKDRVIPSITPSSLKLLQEQPGVSRHIDVTGGMKQKVALMTSLVEKIPATTISIFSGLHPGNLKRVLNGEFLGTTIRFNPGKEQKS